VATGGDIPSPRIHHTCLASDDELFLIGGFDGGTKTCDMLKIKPYNGQSSSNSMSDPESSVADERKYDRPFPLMRQQSMMS